MLFLKAEKPLSSKAQKSYPDSELELSFFKLRTVQIAFLFTELMHYYDDACTRKKASHINVIYPYLKDASNFDKFSR